MSGRDAGRLRRLLFRATLLGYPRAFRQRWSAELESTFEEGWRAEASNSAAAASFWLLLLVDGAVNGLRARLAGRRAARAALGTKRSAGGSPALQRIHERRRGPVWSAMFHGAMNDGRLALRGLRLQRGSAFAVVLTLALGIGAAAAIFTVVDAVLLRPLPFATPERLVELQRNTQGGVTLTTYPTAIAAELLDGAGIYESIAAHARLDGVLTGEGDARKLRVHASTPALLATLGRAPALGRAYTEAEVRSGARVMVISHALWRSLGGERTIIGRLLEFDGDRYEVVGVLPPEFRFPTRYAADAFVPLTPDFVAAGLPQQAVGLIARLPPAMDAGVAAARTATWVATMLAGESTPPTWVAGVEPLGDHRISDNGRRALWLVSGAVALMLLIALMNATNLLLTRVSVRAREFAVRHSLGASAPRLLRQLVTESLVLALLAGGAAVLLALAGVAALMRFAPPELTELAANRVVLDGRVLLFVFGVTTVAGFALGLLPAWAAAGEARRRIGASLSIYAGTTRDRHRVRGGLVVGQVALAMTLLVGAGLLTTSFMRVMRVDAGMDLDRVVLLQIEPNERAYPTGAARRAFSTALEERIAALPGVAAVTRADGLPPSSNFWFGVQLQAEEDEAPRESPPLLPFASVRPDYLPTLGTRIVEGRNFTSADTRESNVAIIDRDLARFFWGDGAAVGRRFRTGPEAPWLLVVGVVHELMLGGPDNYRGGFVVLTLAPATLSSAFLAVRATGDARSIVQPVRDAVRAVDPNQPVWNLWTARAALADEVAQRRFFMVVMVVLGAVSLLLAALGLYGLLAFSVSRRTRELGIRMALGARAGSVVGMVVRQGLRLAAAGILLGLAGALAGARLIESLLFDTSPQQPVALAGIAAFMIAVALVASAVPALRAANTDPMRVLRTD